MKYIAIVAIIATLLFYILTLQYNLENNMRS